MSERSVTIVVHTDGESETESVSRILSYLEEHAYIPRAT